MTNIKVGLGIFFALASSCNVEVKNVRAPVILPEQFSVSGQSKMPEKWWQAFNDETLNQLCEQALNDNFSLLAVFNRLEQARALARKSGAELIPQISNEIIASQKSGDTPTLNNFILGLAASYELDLWGRIRANIQAAELDVNAAQEDLAIAALSLTAEIASTWYRLIEQRQQLQLLDKQIKTNSDSAEMILTRFQLGQATAADVFQQRQLLASVTGEKATVIATIKVLENTLAILTGKAPGTTTIPIQDNFPVLPALPETGLSASLIQRRPDIRRAYVKIQAADQRVASAIADRFPKLSLAAGINTSAPDLQSLFNNWLATIAGNLITPILDGGRRVAEVDRNKAVAAEAMNNYATALIQSIQEVENALIQEQQQQQLITQLDQQVHLSQLATTQILTRYSYGAIEFLRLLTALLSQQSVERNRLRAQQQLVDYRISLYRALAGEFPLPLEKTTEQL